MPGSSGEYIRTNDVGISIRGDDRASARLVAPAAHRPAEHPFRPAALIMVLGVATRRKPIP